MSELIVPPTLAALLQALSSCFQTRSSLTFQWLVLGWVQCQGRRTLTSVALASGALGHLHISVFHRFFSRAAWNLDRLGHVMLGLALAWLPDDQPLVLLGDDTLARKSGKSIALASMHHDPLLSSARKPFASFGHVWVVLAVWVPLPFGSGRGFALPILFRLYVGAKRGGERHRAGQTQSRLGPRLRAARTAYAQHQQATKLELLREMIILVAHWAEERSLYLVVDSAYAGKTILEDRPANVQVISRLRLDAALYAPPPPRRPGQKGRPRRRGDRLPPLQQVIARHRRWTALPLVLYGRAVTPRVFTCTAVWYGALRWQQVHIVVVRDPSRRRRDEAFFCTDLHTEAAFILHTYAARWTLEHRQPQRPDRRLAGGWSAWLWVLSESRTARSDRNFRMRAPAGGLLWSSGRLRPIGQGVPEHATGCARFLDQPADALGEITVAEGSELFRIGSRQSNGGTDQWFAIGRRASSTSAASAMP
jgi:DDE superfamily endonuclease